MNIVIPSAGAGTRFKRVGYEKPKPLINVCGKPMIQWVIENMIIDDTNKYLNFILLFQDEHYKAYNIESVLDDIFKMYEGKNISYEIITIDRLTEGAACTVLKARKLIDNDDELIIANSDQYMDWSSKNFIQVVDSTKCDGAVITFFSTNPKWSFAYVSEEGWINQIKEKEVISPHATVGVYYFRKGSDFVFSSDEMIHKNLRVNGEFYVAPVYNQLISQLGSKILNYPIPIQSMWGLGTPEDLIKFINNKEGK